LPAAHAFHGSDAFPFHARSLPQSAASPIDTGQSIAAAGMADLQAGSA
jgi:hypothetical protein